MTPQQAQAAEWAQRVRRLEPVAMSWIYDSAVDQDETLARRVLAQTVGLRRLLDQMAGRVSAHTQRNGVNA
jgi:hypothetical protein